ncbi:MAG TPA: DUF6542 domain-containing protein [Jatrophihabitans sp.]|nr:DUF6542 domain-containing protein [Jatrophihabitans sp.]
MPDEPETSIYNVPGRRGSSDPYGVPGRSARGGRDSYADAARADRDPYTGAPRGARDEYGYARPPDFSGYPDAVRAEPLSTRQARQRTSRRERGLPGWMAVVLLVAIAGACGLVDSINGSSIRGVFNWGLVVASLLAILVVRRSQMFSVVIAPPLVYLAASAGLLYVRTGGLSSRSKIIDVGTNWIVYGFPAIAGATAVVLVIAGIRLVTRR